MALVLQVAVVEAEAGVDEDFSHRCAGRFRLAGEVVAHHRRGVGGEVEIIDFANVSCLDVNR